MNSAHDLTEVQIKNLIARGTAPKIEEEDIEALIVKEEFHQFEGTTLITCVLTLKNGYTVSGESACADPTNFKEDTGRALARKQAKGKIWSLEGYVLKNKLALIEAATKPTMPDADVKTYVGTKVVHACPMTRLTYNKLRGWELPANENGDDAGYLVEYADGGAPNLPPFRGYVSWSPKDVFEKAYTPGVTLKKTTYVERMLTEVAELGEKIKLLDKFIEGNIFPTIDIVDGQDLVLQLQAMSEYHSILSRRLQRAQKQS